MNSTWLSAVKVLLFSVSLWSAGCATQTRPVENGVTPMSEDAYNALIRKSTFKTNQYAGIYQTFQADMTIESTAVETAALQKRAYYLQWDQKRYQMEREKIMQENAAYAKFFLRFFSPDNSYDDLHKGKTIWRVYLEVNGQRLEGKVAKLFDKFVELQTIYPHLDRFSTPYEITFDVPMNTVEATTSKVILTSSLGNAEYVFPPQK